MELLSNRLHTVRALLNVAKLSSKLQYNLATASNIGGCDFPILAQYIIIRVSKICQSILIVSAYRFNLQFLNYKSIWASVNCPSIFYLLSHSIIFLLIFRSALFQSHIVVYIINIVFLVIACLLTLCFKEAVKTLTKFSSW